MSWQRNALFTVFDSVERDLVAMLRRNLGNIEAEWLNSAERTRARERLVRRGNESAYNLEADYDLVWGLDLGDKFQILIRNSNLLDRPLADYLKALAPTFEKIVPVRNDTMHGRPLTIEAFAIGFQFGDALSKRADLWPELHRNYRQHSTDLNYFQNMVITYELESALSEPLNNLPKPDYDDTGFLPRPKLQVDLKNKILGRYPVVTVLGEGGNGKTALTLHTVYHLLHSNDHNFDAIIWVSAKNNFLSTNEIKRIQNAISDSLGILENVALQFGEESGDPLEIVRRLLKNFKVLLVIDNLETVLDENMRRLAEDVPGDSKIVFTSRVPLGVDLVVPVSEFSDTEALSYARRLIAAYGVERLKKTTDKELTKYITRLHRKPLLIKWFVIGVLSGISAEKIVSDPEIALKFCLENVIDRLDESSRKAAIAFAALGGTCSAAVIQEVTNMTALEVEGALATLLKFSLLEESEGNKYEKAFTMRPFTIAYMARVAQTNKDLSELYLRNFRRIESAFQDERSRQRTNRYMFESYTVRSTAEAITVQALRVCVRQALDGDPQRASEKIQELLINNASFFEVYRVGAFVAILSGDLIGARNFYEKAIDIDAKQPQLYYWFGGFLLRHLQDFEAAAKQLELAHSLDPDEFVILREAARCAMFLGEWDRAESILFNASSLNQSDRDAVVLVDLKAQLLVRQAEHFARAGKVSVAVEKLAALKNFTVSNARFVDLKMRDHIAKARHTIAILLPKADEQQRAMLEEVSNWLNDFAPAQSLSANVVNDNSAAPAVGGRLSGFVKPQGLQPTFGFVICERSRVEYFVPKQSVTADTWAKFVSGNRVSFRPGKDDKGRLRAEDLEVAN